MSEVAAGQTDRQEVASGNILKQGRKICDELADISDRTRVIADNILGSAPSPIAPQADDAKDPESPGFQQQVYDHQSGQFELLECIRTTLNRIETFI